jgi:hypothetical protein
MDRRQEVDSESEDEIEDESASEEDKRPAPTKVSKSQEIKTIDRKQS